MPLPVALPPVYTDIRTLQNAGFIPESVICAIADLPTVQPRVGAFLKDPVTGKFYGQSDGAGGYSVLAPPAGYGSTETERLAGVPSLTGLALVVSEAVYPRGFILEQMNNVAVQACNGSLTWTASDSGVPRVPSDGTNYVLFSTGGAAAHGITAAANRHISVYSWASGVAGLYPVESVPSASTVRLKAAWIAGMGIPVVADNTLQAYVATFTVPGGSMGPNGIIELDALITPTATANNKTARWKIGSYESNTVYTSAAARMQGKIFNLGAQNANGRTTALDGSAAVDVSGTTDTSLDQTMRLSFLMATAGEIVTINSLRITLYPGV